MSRKANPTVIGTFVFGAIVLMVLAVLAFGGRELFQRKERFVTYFQGSVQGLRIGSNVLFRGVRVGYVTDIRLNADPSMLNFEIPVIFEIIPGTVRVLSDGGPAETPLTGPTRIKEMIAAGLRAQLNFESWVTGQLAVDLDMHPGTPAIFRGRNPLYAEIPSIPSGIQQFLERLQSLLSGIQDKQVERIVNDLVGAVSGLNQLVNSRDLKEALAGVNRLINAKDTQDLPTSLEGTLKELRAATTEARSLIGRTDERLAPVLEHAVPAMEQLERTLREGEGVLSLAHEQIASNPEVAAELGRTLREVERSARAIRVLVDYLQRQPESVLRGKPKSEEMP